MSKVKKKRKKNKSRYQSPKEYLQYADEFPVYQCFINSDFKDLGIASVVVTRKIHGASYIFTAFLCDIFCLGLKNVICNAKVPWEMVEEYLEDTPMEFEEISYEKARGIVLGSIRYAAKLGFDPHEDWRLSRTVIEYKKSFKVKINFGKNEKPFYIPGPDDDQEAIRAKLGEIGVESFDEGEEEKETDDQLAKSWFSRAFDQLTKKPGRKLSKEERKRIKKALESMPDKFRTIEENISVELQEEYIHLHNVVNCNLSEKQGLKKLKKLLAEDLKKQEKKKILVELGHVPSVDVLNGLKDYTEKEDYEELKQFALIAYRECEMFVRNDLLGESEGMIMKSSGDSAMMTSTFPE